MVPGTPGLKITVYPSIVYTRKNNGLRYIILREFERRTLYRGIFPKSPLYFRVSKSPLYFGTEWYSEYEISPATRYEFLWLGYRVFRTPKVL